MENKIFPIRYNFTGFSPLFGVTLLTFKEYASNIGRAGKKEIVNRPFCRNSLVSIKLLNKLGKLPLMTNFSFVK